MQNDGVLAPQAESTPSAPAAGQDFSGTNVQEAGVDEPDAVKTDGQRIFVAENGRLYALDAQADPPKLLGSIPLDGYGQELLLSGDRLLVLSGTPIAYPMDVVAPMAPRAPARAAVVPPTVPQQSTVTLVDVSDAAAMKVLKTMSVTGGYLTGHSARVIFSATPQALPMLQAVARDIQRPKLARTTTPDWRPTYKLRRGRTGRVARRALVRCTSIERPAVFSGLNSLTVLTIDLSKGLDPVDSDAIMTDGQTVYASKDSLYIATQKAIAEQPNAEQPPPSQQTDIHKFDISKADQTVYEGSGVVSGTLLNQYSMSEQDGFLRVASTDAPLWWSANENRPSESFVSVLKQAGAALKQVGRVGDLGKHERIYAVRFLGDVGYVVTFRQIDPLYTVGLADPEHPKVLGSVDLLGYSAYLHPVGAGLLLGIGQAANEQGRTQGTQVSLFDVSDPAKPTRLSNKLVGAGSSSSVEFDPYAFLWWDPLKLAVLPVQVFTYQGDGKADQFTGAIAFRASRAAGVNEAGRMSQPPDSYGYAPPIVRSLVVGDRLFTISMSGARASGLGSFADRGFVAFPVPRVQPGSGSVPPGQPVVR